MSYLLKTYDTIGFGKEVGFNLSLKGGVLVSRSGSTVLRFI